MATRVGERRVGPRLLPAIPCVSQLLVLSVQLKSQPVLSPPPRTAAASLRWWGPAAAAPGASRGAPSRPWLPGSLARWCCCRPLCCAPPACLPRMRSRRWTEPATPPSGRAHQQAASVFLDSCLDLLLLHRAVSALHTRTSILCKHVWTIGMTSARDPPAARCAAAAVMIAKGGSHRGLRLIHRQSPRCASFLQSLSCWRVAGGTDCAVRSASSVPVQLNPWLDPHVARCGVCLRNAALRRRSQPPPAGAPPVAGAAAVCSSAWPTARGCNSLPCTSGTTL